MDLEIALHWPHDRFCIGWEFMNADKEHNYATFRLFLGVVTLTFNKYNNER